MNTLQELYPTATKEQLERNKKSLIQNAIDNGYTDEDTPDSEAMDSRYEYSNSEAYEDMKNEAINHLTHQ